MNKTLVAVLLSGTFVFASTAAHAMRIRGTIESVNGGEMQFKTLAGRDMKIETTPKTAIAYPERIKLSDIKPGTPLGASAAPGPDGKLVAKELHVFPAGGAIPDEGKQSWDTGANSSMTNGSVSSTATVGNGRQLTINYKGGSEVVRVPDNVPVVKLAKGDQSLLKPGEYAFIVADMNNDGKIVASRIQVSKNGVKPAQ